MKRWQILQKSQINQAHQVWRTISVSLAILVMITTSSGGFARAALKKESVKAKESLAVAEKPLRDFYKRLDLVSQKDDFKGLANLLEKNTTSDWTSTGKEGNSLSRGFVIGMLRHHDDFVPESTAIAEGKSEQVKYEQVITKIRRKECLAYVDYRTSSTITEVDTEGRYGAKGVSHRVTHLTSALDTWVKQEGTWKLLRSQEYATLLKVDGTTQSDES